MLDQATEPVCATTIVGAPPARYAKVGGWLSIAWFVYSHFDVPLDLINVPATTRSCWVRPTFICENHMLSIKTTAKQPLPAF